MKIQLPPRAALLDSNMLIGYFNPNDQHYALANYTIETLDWNWIVVQAVLTEAWGILNRRSAHLAREMLEEIGSPGRFFFLDFEPFDLPTCRAIVSKHNVDVADAMITNIAAHLNQIARPLRIPIFTFDVGDFTRIVRGGIVFDVQNQEPLEMPTV